MKPTYTDVAGVADIQSSAGQKPTIETVRLALGGASRNEIAPLLKQWKRNSETAQRVEGDAANSGLPTLLLSAVRSLYEMMETESKTAVLVSMENNAIKLREAREEVSKADARSRLYQIENEGLRRDGQRLATELDEMLRKLTMAESDFLESESKREVLEAEFKGEQARLKDRTKEVSLLERQLTSSREQAEHYHNSVAAQRQEDRVASDARERSLEARLREQENRLSLEVSRYLDLKSVVVHGEARIRELEADNARLIKDAKSNGVAAGKVRSKSQWRKPKALR